MFLMIVSNLLGIFQWFFFFFRIARILKCHHVNFGHISLSNEFAAASDIARNLVACPSGSGVRILIAKQVSAPAYWAAWDVYLRRSNDKQVNLGRKAPNWCLLQFAGSTGTTWNLHVFFLLLAATDSHPIAAKDLWLEGTLSIGNPPIGFIAKSWTVEEKAEMVKHCPESGEFEVQLQPCFLRKWWFSILGWSILQVRVRSLLVCNHFKATNQNKKQER